MAFSGALTLTDLNDFITPSQACIKPVTQLNSNEPKEKDPGAATVRLDLHTINLHHKERPQTEIQIDRSGAYYEVTQDWKAHEAVAPASAKKLEQAQINLNDCLACSGCITSAESVLITLQSHTEVLTFLESNEKRRHASITPESSISTPSEPYKIPIISVSPQTLASLAAAAGAATPSTSTTSQHPTPRQILRRVRAFCTEILGFASVFDTTFARHLALQEHVAEFEERWRAVGEDLGSEASNGIGTGQSAKGLPMLASACPGWICYAEKAHSEMLPFISRTKSPQQVMGTLVKNWMSARWGKLPNEIYHVTVMPCYDKKLEASRSDFYNDIYATRDVDCVITTGELEFLMKEKSWDITQPVLGELDEDHSASFDGGTTQLSTNPSQRSQSWSATPPIQFPELLTHPGTSSGSYLHAIITHIQTTSDAPLTLHLQTVRGADYEEYSLLKKADEPGKEDIVVFKGAKCYGFRNLQNVVRRVGRERGIRTGSGAAGKLGGRTGVGVARRLAGRKATEGKGEKKERGYDYVEVMACPGGCVNGGGQLKPVVAVPETSAPPLPPAVDQEGYKRDWEGGGVALAPTFRNASAIDVTQNARWGSKEWIKGVEEEYWREPLIDSNQLADGLARQIFDDLCGTGDDTARVEKRRTFFRTQYRAVESEVIGLAVVW
ncbi:hypothetical protein H0H87_005906 [Tephrocybe sp. NHM501043]|nr:hypothetical protein H0H87_005906 [Tephrocybe sp. NHM501043]